LPPAAVRAAVTSGDDNDIDPDATAGRAWLDRRAYLAAVASAAAAATAGCNSSGDTGATTDAPTDPPTAAPGTTATERAAATEQPTTTERRTPSVAALRVEPDEPRQTRPLTVHADVSNPGSEPADVYVAATVAGSLLGSREVAVDPGATTTVTYETTGVPSVGETTVEATVRNAGDVLDAATRTVPVRQYPASFVETDGTQFVVDGAEFRFFGGNTNSIPVAMWGESHVDAFFSYVADHGVTAVRTWGFPPEWTDSEVHPEPGRFRDDWLRHLDYQILSAKRHGVRLILPLINNWYTDAHAPSPAAYAAWSDTADGVNDFFADEQANQYFRNYVEHVLTHENHLTGVQYREDPTILLWEVGNEMEYHGDRRGESLADWYDRSAAHIKSIDDTHLVSTGMHGATGETHADWNRRNAYVESHQSEHIDACSFHNYPVSEWDGEVSADSQSSFETYLREHVRKAHDDVGKPAYVGELGVHVEPDTEYTVENRNDYFETATRVADDTGLPGFAFWRPSLPTAGANDITHDSSEYAVLPSDDSTWSVFESYVETL
jgi:hypothetical protein